MLTGALLALAPACAAAPSPPQPTPMGCLTASRVRCFTPQRLRAAYAVQPLLNRGVDGRGRTIVIVDLLAARTGSSTDIRSDLTAFDRYYSLPAAKLQLVAPFDSGADTKLAGGEELLDVEMAHAIAPGAAIKVVLVGQGKTFSKGFAKLRDAIGYGISRGDVISFSHSFGEGCFTRRLVESVHAVLEGARASNVTVVGSSGDYGAVAKPCGGSKVTPVREVGYPASDPLVLAAGGTRLKASQSSGTWKSEVVWNRPPKPGRGAKREHSDASGGGFSELFATPPYQSGVQGISSRRGVPDVASDADAATGLALVKVVHGQVTVVASGGTSAAAPLWAGLAALADQYAGRRLGYLNPSIYRVAEGSAYHSAFHDILSGDNTVIFDRHTITGYSAGPGWDPVTGWGSPDAAVLVPMLAR